MSAKKTLFTLWIIASALGVTHAQGLADDPSLSREFKEIAPREMPAPTPQTETKDQPVKRPPASTRVLAPVWNGLVLLPNQESVNLDGITSMSGFSGVQDKISYAGLDIPDPDALHEELKTVMSEPVSRAQINAAIKAIILHYRKNDRPMVDVFLPKQAMREGIVQLVVSESRLGKVRLEGNEYFSEQQYLSNIRTEEGGLIQRSTMAEDVAWINRNPFRRAELLYEKGEQPGTTDAIVKTEETFPLRVNAGFNDSGNRATSYETLTTGFNWGKPFGLDDQLNYGYTTRLQNSYLKAHSLTYIKPLPWRHTLTLIGSRSDSKLDLGRVGNPNLKLKSSSWSTGARYQIPVDWLNQGDSISLGYDFKRSKNGNPLLNNIPLANPAKTDVSQFSGTYQTLFPIPEGFISVGATAIFSPGGMGGNNVKRPAAAIPAGAVTALNHNPNYWIGKVNVTAVRGLPKDFSLMLRGSAQKAEHELPGSERFTVGGYGSVRGYDASEGPGDAGYSLSAELSTKGFTVLDKLKIKHDKLPEDSLKFIGFIDYGAAFLTNRPAAGQPENFDLLSIGPGLRYNIGTYLTLRFDYGFQLKDSGATPNNRNTRNQRAHFAIDASF